MARAEGVTLCRLAARGQPIGAPAPASASDGTWYSAPPPMWHSHKEPKPQVECRHACKQSSHCKRCWPQPAQTQQPCAGCARPRPAWDKVGPIVESILHATSWPHLERSRTWEPRRPGQDHQHALHLSGISGSYGEWWVVASTGGCRTHARDRGMNLRVGKRAATNTGSHCNTCRAPSWSGGIGAQGAAAAER